MGAPRHAGTPARSSRHRVGESLSARSSRDHHHPGGASGGYPRQSSEASSGSTDFRRAGQGESGSSAYSSGSRGVPHAPGAGHDRCFGNYRADGYHRSYQDHGSRRTERVPVEKQVQATSDGRSAGMVPGCPQASRRGLESEAGSRFEPESKKYGQGAWQAAIPRFRMSGTQSNTSRSTQQSELDMMAMRVAELSGHRPAKTTTRGVARCSEKSSRVSMTSVDSLPLGAEWSSF